MQYTFVIATVSRTIELQYLLDSIKAQSVKDYEIIVVDQNKDDRVKSICNNVAQLNYIHSERRGLSLARNLGIKKATGNYIIFPDDDAILSNNFLEIADNIIHIFTTTSIFSGLVLTLDKQVPFSRYMNYESEELTYRNYNKFMSTTMIIHKEVFNKIGGFDEEMGLGTKWGGSEETEILLRALKAGIKAYYSSSLIAYHPVADSSLLTWRQAIKKGYSYGKGRGALYGKLNRSFGFSWILNEWIISLMKSIAGIVISLMRSQRADSLRHLGALLGRIVGFMLVKRNHT